MSLLSRLVFSTMLFAATAGAQETAGRIYVMSEHQVIARKHLQTIAEKVQANYDRIGVRFTHASAVEDFPELKPLDALIILLNNGLPDEKGKSDCPLQGNNVAESDILSLQSYDMMQKRLGFPYDKDTVRGGVAYICPGWAAFHYRFIRVLKGNLDTPVIDMELFLSGIATHEVGHMLNGVHVFSSGDPLYIPADGYFMGSTMTFNSDKTVFDERNAVRIRRYVDDAQGCSTKELNVKKSLTNAEYYVQKP